MEEARTLASLVAANTMEDRIMDEQYDNNNNNNNNNNKNGGGFNIFKRNTSFFAREKNVEVLICPPAAFLSEVSQLVRFSFYAFS